MSVFRARYSKILVLLFAKSYCATFVILSIAITVWARFSREYQNAVSSLRNIRGRTSVRDEIALLCAGKRSSTGQVPGSKHKMTVTWTNKFVCLADTTVNKVPTTYAARMSAGLGEKKITIRDIDCTPTQFQEELAEHFPKLHDSWGFELLRCVPNSQKL